MMNAANTAREFDDLMRRRALGTVFQPIVRLDDRRTVGYEALVRGPAGSPLASANALLDAAYRADRVVEFDWVARACACRAALDGQLGPNRLLFLNIEPLALGTDCPPDLWPDIERAFGVFKVVLEITERSVGRDPRSLFEGVDRQRPTAAGLALDDVGPMTTALAMLPVLSADLIKLDLTVTQASTTAPSMKVLDIALEEAERTGATILAEGIETDDHLRQASAFGADLGQGNYFGQPGPLPPDERDSIVASVDSEAIVDVATPFEALVGRPTHRATAEFLRPFSHQVAFGETDLAEPALVIQLVPDPDLFGPAERQALTRLAGRGVIAGVLGPGAFGVSVPGVRGAPVHESVLDGQWALLALSPSSAGAMLARAVPGTAEFEFGVTHDRRRVVVAARCLLRRLGPLPAESPVSGTAGRG
jgi:EAL domain-containing protein (putative c-di-GMP-specific phosphodiesterase class I)